MPVLASIIVDSDDPILALPTGSISIGMVPLSIAQVTLTTKEFETVREFVGDGSVRALSITSRSWYPQLR